MARVAAAPLGIALSVTVCAACFFKPGPPGGADSDPDASVTGDIVVPVDVMTTCPIRDTFDGGSVCGSWGFDDGSGSHIATRSGGKLLFYATTSGGAAACQGTADVAFTTVVLQIASIVNSSGAKTGAKLSFNDGATLAIEVASQGNGSAQLTTILNDNPPVLLEGYSASTMQYFRIRKQAGGQAIALSYGADATSWPTTTTVSISSTLARARIRLYATFGPSVPGYVSATFDNLDMCAP